MPVNFSYTGYDVRHEAAWAGCTENLQHLFESGAADASGTSNPHTGWPDNVTLLYWATHNRDLVELLLQNGADPEVQIKGNGERGTTVLQHAIAPPYDGAGAPWLNPERAARGNETAEFLLAQGVNYDLYSACGRDDIDRVRQLAAQDDAAVGRPGEAGMTPLHWAARGNASRCTKWLLTKAVDVNAETISGRTPLHMAAEWGHSDMIWQLAGQGADLNCQDSKGRTPLHRATYGGQVGTAECLIVLGASTRLETRTGKTAMESARFDCKFLKKVLGATM